MQVRIEYEMDDQAVEAVQELVQMNIDSRDGLRDAAQMTEDMTISTLFEHLANEREQQANELCSFVTFNGEEPNRDGSFAAALHRSWMSIRLTFSPDDLYTLLAEAERGEDQIKRAYEDALHTTAGTPIYELLSDQYTHVTAAHDRIRDLRDERAAK